MKYSLSSTSSAVVPLHRLLLNFVSMESPARAIRLQGLSPDGLHHALEFLYCARLQPKCLDDFGEALLAAGLDIVMAGSAGTLGVNVCCIWRLVHSNSTIITHGWVSQRMSKCCMTFCTVHIQGLEVFGNGFCRGGVVEELGQENVDHVMLPRSCWNMGEDGGNMRIYCRWSTGWLPESLEANWSSLVNWSQWDGFQFRNCSWLTVDQINKLVLHDTHQVFCPHSQSTTLRESPCVRTLECKDYARVSSTATLCRESIKGLWELTLAVLAHYPCLVNLAATEKRFRYWQAFWFWSSDSGYQWNMNILWTYWFIWYIGTATWQLLLCLLER